MFRKGDFIRKITKKGLRQVRIISRTANTLTYADRQANVETLYTVDVQSNGKNEFINWGVWNGVSHCSFAFN